MKPSRYITKRKSGPRRKWIQQIAKAGEIRQRWVDGNVGGKLKSEDRKDKRRGRQKRKKNNISFIHIHKA